MRKDGVAMIPREILQIIAYLDIQIKAKEQKQNLMLTQTSREEWTDDKKIEYTEARAGAEALEITKKWILAKFSE